MGFYRPTTIPSKLIGQNDDSRSQSDSTVIPKNR